MRKLKFVTKVTIKTIKANKQTRHLTGDDTNTLCGLDINGSQWEVHIGCYNPVIKQCKKCFKIKEKYNAKVY